jgi:hypothetical protein
MIVFDENMRQRNIMDAVAAWYRGRVISVTVFRPGSIIKDEAIPTLLRRAQRPTFVTTNVDDFWQRVPAHTRYGIVVLIMALATPTPKGEATVPKHRGKEACKDSDVRQGVRLWRLQWVGTSPACDRETNV